MMVIKSEGMAFRGFSWIVLLFHLFIRTLHEWIVIGCEIMWVTLAGNPEIQNTHEVWKSWNQPSSLSVSRQFRQKRSTSQCLLLLRRMWDHWDGVSNAKAAQKWQQVLLSSVPGDGDVQVACVFLCVTVALRCAKLILRFWVSACIDPGRARRVGVLYMQMLSWLLMWFIVLVLILYRMPSAWRDKPMRSKT